MNLNRIRTGTGRKSVAAAAVAALLFLTACSSDDAEADEPTTQETAESTTTTTQPASDVEVATRYWEAIASGDRDAALALVDPAAIASENVAPFGRAHTLEGQFDWYESVGMVWQLDECSEAAGGAVECTASASNTWSDSLGVGAVTGTFVVEVSDDGVTAVTEPSESFISQWSPMVFRMFAEWVDENHPEDAEIMFNFDVDINEEVLELYEINTNRFAEAQSSG